MSDHLDLLRFRQNYQLPGSVYANTSSNGIMSRHTLDTGIHADHSYALDADSSRAYWVQSGHGAVKQTLAHFLDCSVNNLALVPNCSLGLNLLVQSLDTNASVLLFEKEYPSLTAPFELNMKRVIRIPFKETVLSTQFILEQLNQHKPNILALSWVHWLSGFRVDLKELCAFCQDRNIITCIDATQAIGAFPLSTKDIRPDILVASGYKWLLAGHGNGFVYLSNKLLDRLTFRTAGFNSYDFDGDTWSLEESVRCLEPGHSDHISFSRLSAAVHEHIEIGPEKIASAVSSLVALFVQELNKIGIKHLSSDLDRERSGIVSVDLSKDQVHNLQSEDIRFVRRGGFARFGWHFYNLEEEVLKVIDLLRNS